MTETTLTPTDGLFTSSDHVDTWQVKATQQVSYEIRICEDAFSLGSTALLTPMPADGSPVRRFVVIDSRVEQLHGERIRAYFEHHGAEVGYHCVQIDETVKGLDTATEIVRAIDAFGIDRRREPIIAIGGGVLLDIAGLVASLYRRGTPLVRVPTTLIGLVDAGVGVKTGVNFNGHKNRLGTYYSTMLTLLDRSFLATVERRHLANGLAEMLKMALIKDAALFTLLEQHGGRLLDGALQGDRHGEGKVAAQVIQRAVHGMLEELQPNLWESTLERIVDYGHTFSPTIEMHALPKLLHGEAVTIDMALTTVLAWRRGLVGAEQRDRIFAVMNLLELPSWNDLLEPRLLQDALRETVRHRNGKQRLPLPLRIGRAVIVNDVTDAELEQAVRDLREFGSARGDAMREAAA